MIVVLAAASMGGTPLAWYENHGIYRCLLFPIVLPYPENPCYDRGTWQFSSETFLDDGAP